jgi:predicted lactoylglutathione lyase
LETLFCDALTEQRFKDFTKKKFAMPIKNTEVLIAIDADSRKVDEMVKLQMPVVQYIWNHKIMDGCMDIVLLI